MTRRVLVDTGPIVAILLRSDQFHDACVEQLHHIAVPMTTCWPVITEAAWLLRAYPEALQRLLASFRAGTLEIAPLGEADLPEIAAVLGKYKALKIQLADACLAQIAHRDGIDTVFTLDRRDFGVIRLAGGKKLHLIP